MVPPALQRMTMTPGQDQRKANFLRECERLMQDGSREQRNHQRYATRKERARVSRRGEQQAGIHGQHHGRAAAQH